MAGQSQLFFEPGQFALEDLELVCAAGQRVVFLGELLLAFEQQGLEPDVVFTARDADVIKTYVRMGLGVGIVASMAEDCEDQKDMTALDAEGLFPRSTTWIGFRKDIVLRRYMLDFVQLFAPHITSDQLEKTRHARTQAELDKLFNDAKLPVRGGCDEDITVAA